MFRKVGLAFDHALGAGACISCIVIAAIMLLVCTDIILRFAFNNPLGLTVELSEASLVYITALSVAWLLRREGHVSVDIILSQLSPRGQALANAITSALCAIALLILTWSGIQGVLYVKGIEVFETLIGMPLNAQVIPLTIGIFLFAVEFMRRSYRNLKVWRQIG